MAVLVMIQLFVMSAKKTYHIQHVYIAISYQIIKISSAIK